LLFGVFFFPAHPALAIAGLTVCGVGLANLYPLSLALTLAAAPGNGDTANARTQLLGGILVIAAPYLLGSLADHLGLRAAFTVEPALIAAAALLLLAGLRPARPARLPGHHPGSRVCRCTARYTAHLVAHHNSPLPVEPQPSPGPRLRRHRHRLQRRLRRAITPPDGADLV
jgi:MFS family permease